MHLLTHHINSVLPITLLKCRCLLTTFAVNHAVDQWRRRPLACVEAKVGQFEHC